MKVLYVGEQPTREDAAKKSIFLAGPSPRGSGDKMVGQHWRPEALKILSEKGFFGVVYVPLLEDGDWLGHFEKQMDWELEHLEKADVIAFWVPRDLKTLPGLTTNIEFGMYLKSGKIVLGSPPEADNMRYMTRLARLHDVYVSPTLDDMLRYAIKMTRGRR